MKSVPNPQSAPARLWIASIGITLAVLTILLGRVVRIAFGLNKHPLKRGK